MRKPILIACFLPLRSRPRFPSVAGECPYTPARDSAERMAILGRGPQAGEKGARSARYLRGFESQRLRTLGILEADPLQPDGGAVDWSISEYADAVADDMCGGYVHALLVKKGGVWRGTSARDLCDRRSVGFVA